MAGFLPATWQLMDPMALLHLITQGEYTGRFRCFRNDVVVFFGKDHRRSFGKVLFFCELAGDELVASVQCLIPVGSDAVLYDLSEHVILVPLRQLIYLVCHLAHSGKLECILPGPMAWEQDQGFNEAMSLLKKMAS